MLDNSIVFPCSLDNMKLERSLLYVTAGSLLFKFNVLRVFMLACRRVYRLLELLKGFVLLDQEGSVCPQALGQEPQGGIWSYYFLDVNPSYLTISRCQCDTMWWSADCWGWNLYQQNNSIQFSECGTNTAHCRDIGVRTRTPNFAWSWWRAAFIVWPGLEQFVS